MTEMLEGLFCLLGLLSRTDCCLELIVLDYMKGIFCFFVIYKISPSFIEIQLAYNV